MIYLPWIIFGLGCGFLICRGFAAKRKEDAEEPAGLGEGREGQPGKFDNYSEAYDAAWAFLSKSHTMSFKAAHTELVKLLVRPTPPSREGEK